MSPAPNYRIDKAAVRIEFTRGDLPEGKLHLGAELLRSGTYWHRRPAFCSCSVARTKPATDQEICQWLKWAFDMFSSAQGLRRSCGDTDRAQYPRPTFDPGWHPGARRDLVIEYNFERPRRSRRKAKRSPLRSFYLVSPGWHYAAVAPQAAEPCVVLRPRCSRRDRPIPWRFLQIFSCYGISLQAAWPKEGSRSDEVSIWMQPRRRPGADT